MLNLSADKVSLRVLIWLFQAREEANVIRGEGDSGRFVRAFGQKNRQQSW